MQNLYIYFYMPSNSADFIVLSVKASLIKLCEKAPIGYKRRNIN